MTGPSPALVKSILVHTCFAQAMGDPQPAKCLCRKMITYGEALLAIERGEAEWLKCFSSTAKGSQYSYRAIVRDRERQVPKAATIDARHIERAYVDEDKQAAIRIEEYGLLTLELRASWIGPFRPGPESDD